MSTDVAPRLITAEELAKLMNVSERTLWRLLSGGKLLKPVRIGRNTRWRLAEVDPERVPARLTLAPSAS